MEVKHVKQQNWIHIQDEYKLPLLGGIEPQHRGLRSLVCWLWAMGSLEFGSSN